MTKNEQQNFTKNWMKRRTSRVVNVQNGYAEFVENFSADPYNSGTLEETVDSGNGAPTDTTKVNPADGIDGTVSREGGVDEAWQGNLKDAITHIQRAIENVGVNRSVDDGTLAGLNLLASTAQKLTELPSGVSIAQAVANADGVTREPLVVNDNDSSSHSGSRNGFIPTSELSRMESEAGKLTTMTFRIVGITAL
jgi:hypothetical protein